MSKRPRVYPRQPVITPMTQYLLARRGDRAAVGLAKRIGVTRQALRDWECGWSVPRADAVLKIAEVYGDPVEYVLRLAADSITLVERRAS